MSFARFAAISPSPCAIFCGLSLRSPFLKPSRSPSSVAMSMRRSRRSKKLSSTCAASPRSFSNAGTAAAVSRTRVLSRAAARSASAPNSATVAALSAP